MAIVRNRAKTNATATAYVEIVDELVSDVTVEDYKSFIFFLENTDKKIVLNPINFIAYLTGNSPDLCSEYFLGFKKIDKKLSKRPSLVR